MTLNPDQFRPVYENDYGSAKVTPGGYVRDVMVHHAHRGEGHGSDIMRQVTSDADRLGAPLQLHARPDLHPWYGRFGFSPSGEDAMGNLMERRPRGS